MRLQRKGGWCREPRSVVVFSLAILATATFATAGPAPASTAPASRSVLQPTSAIAFRREPPSASEQAAARQRVADAFAADAKDTSLDARVALAHKLRARAAGSFESPADEFALLTAAVDAARDAPDLNLCFRLIDATAMAFRVDANAMKADAVVRVGARAGADDGSANFYNYWPADELATRLMQAEDFDAAAKVAGAAALLGAGDDRTRRDAEKLVHQVKFSRQASADIEKYRLRLRLSPDDPAANLAVGKYLCLVQREWKAAAPLLLKAGDGAFAPIARAMVRKPPPTDFELGNLWWAASDAESDLGFRRVERFFACGYYEDALRSGGRLGQADTAVANDRMVEFKQVDAAAVYDASPDHSATRRRFHLSATAAGEGWAPLAFDVQAGSAYQLIAHGPWSGAGGALFARIVPATDEPEAAARQPVEFLAGSDALFVSPVDGRLELRMKDSGASCELDVEAMEVALRWWNPRGDLTIAASPPADVTLVVGDGGVHWESAPGSAATRTADAPFAAGKDLPTRLNNYLWLARWGDDGSTDSLDGGGSFAASDLLVAKAVHGAAVTAERYGLTITHVQVKPQTLGATGGVRFTLSYGSDAPNASTQPSPGSVGPTTRVASAADVAVGEARALVSAEARVRDLEALCNIRLRRVQTAHFTVFTDWDPANDASFKAVAEWTFTGVDRQFNKVLHMGPVRCGSVPVILLARDSELWRLYHELDGDTNLDGNYAGYYSNGPDGFGRIAIGLAPPDPNRAKDVHDAEWRLGYMWAHELTHAYIARCRSPRDVPSWVNEGLAEIVASREFRTGRSIYPDVQARSFERRPDAARSIEEAWHPMSGDDYPLFQTAVETMLVIDPDGFVGFFNDLKDGVATEQSLRGRFKMDFAKFEAAWKHRVAKLTGAE